MPTLAEGGVITLRIYKTLTANPNLVWANTYEFTQGAAGATVTDFQNLAAAMVNTEAALHLSTTRFIRAIVSTFVPDSQPYNPESFVAFPFSDVGARGMAGLESLPLQVCYRVAKSATYGRQGFWLYRNVLAEQDITSNSGTPALVDPLLGGAFTNYQTAIADEIAGNSGAGGFTLVMARENNTRDVTGVVPSGVTIKKFNNRYFDRTNS